MLTPDNEFILSPTNDNTLVDPCSIPATIKAPPISTTSLDFSNAYDHPSAPHPPPPPSTGMYPIASPDMSQAFMYPVILPIMFLPAPAPSSTSSISPFHPPFHHPYDPNSGTHYQHDACSTTSSTLYGRRQSMNSESPAPSVVTTFSHLSLGTTKKPVCRNWPNCSFGRRCRFHHPPKKATVNGATVRRKSKQLCRNFPDCKFGDGCLFSHQPCAEPIAENVNETTILPSLAPSETSETTS